MTRYIVPLCLIGLLAAGCSKKDEPQQTAAPPAVTPSAAPAEPPAPEPTVVVGAEPTTKLEDHEVPTEEDFENEAEEKITASNLEAARRARAGDRKGARGQGRFANPGIAANEEIATGVGLHELINRIENKLATNESARFFFNKTTVVVDLFEDTR